ncbi:MAG: lipid-A-disaccharide synthase [Rickettsiales bacterium]|nr:lipid-A-disaccharide synthase [Rickettsiales bacterium]
MPKIFIIAGEKSGDNLGAKLISALKAKQNDIEIFGIGGEEMEKTGLKSLFPMKEINLMGFAEIIPHLPNLINRINFTTKKILEEQPEIVITIDSPGFNYRIAKNLRKANFKGKLIHYVAPSVWAYKEKRAKKTAKLFDTLLCILPWEPPYFEKYNLKTYFIGHSLFENLNILSDSEKQNFREKLFAKNNIKNDEKLISVFVGSRLGEVKKHLPIIKKAQELISQKIDCKFAFLTIPHLQNYLESEIGKSDKIIISSENIEKQKIIQISDFAIVKSGTISLEVAALNCPQIIYYKVNKLSHFLIMRMIKIKFANLINISANEEIIPELIQNNCTAENISEKVLEFLENKNLSISQLEKAKIELKKLGSESNQNPSELAADIILTALKHSIN